ncbi:MAG: nodulation protein NfeD [Nitrospiraceae bacterium]|nr:nodulation protein NfeD [Nitrospiraceae bacterium]
MRLFLPAVLAALLAWSIPAIAGQTTALQNSPAAQANSPKILLLDYDGIINPVAADYINNGIEEADFANDQAVIIGLDTPGGLDTSMRSIIKTINASGVPVIVYVSPSGARAASAGVFITMAAHIAAMAPGTNIGAAHPVSMSGKLGKTMSEKVENDAAAYIKSIAESRGRNAQWAQDAVRNSVSISDADALSKHVIDIIAPDIPSLLEQVNGKTVQTAHGKKTLHTLNAGIIKVPMSTRLKILSVISDPNVAYILMLLGFYGLLFEFMRPGAIFPGVIGAISLIVAFYSFQTLPVNYAGFLLILLAIILFILDVKITSHGALAIGGAVSMVIGSIMLFERTSPFIQVSLAFIIPATLISALFFVLTVSLALRAYRRKPVTGPEGLEGLEGVAGTKIDRAGGTALVHGERWAAWADEEINEGEPLLVESSPAQAGLKIKVRKKEGT